MKFGNIFIIQYDPFALDSGARLSASSKYELSTHLGTQLRTEVLWRWNIIFADFALWIKNWSNGHA